jgi:tetratricopeptide (TPR) repeat protein
MSIVIRNQGLLVVTAILVPVVLLVLIEVGLRLGGYGTRSDFFVPIEEQRAYTTNPNFARQFFPPALARLPQPIRVSFDKPDDVMRIVVLGGSAAMGEPEPAYAFSRILDVMLTRTYPDRKFEVINTGMATINSHVVRLIAQECHKIQPDVVLIYMGNNEVVGPFGAGTVFGSYSPSLTLIRAGIWLRTFRLGQLIEDCARWVGGDSQFVTEGQGMAMFRDQSVSADDDRLEKVYSHFDANLRDIVRILRDSGTQVMVSTVGANLVDHSPFASVFGQVGLENPLAWVKLYATAIGHLEAGEREDAVAAFEMANRVDSTHAESHFRLAHLYLERGDTVSARDQFVRARDFDALRFRVDSRLNDMIRRIGTELNPRLVDAARVLGERDRSRIGLPGNDLFHEHVHLTFRGNYLVASAFADQLYPFISGRTHYWDEASAPPELPSLTVCEADLALTAFDRYRLYATVSGLMGRSPFTHQFDYLEKRKRINARVDSLRAAGTSFSGVGGSLRAYQLATDGRPKDLVLQQNHARILQETGALVAATKRWKQLLTKIPDAPTWRLASATSLSDQGAHQAALYAYRELERMMPGLVLPHIQIGYELVSAGQIGEAIHVLGNALRINPGSMVARLNLASLYEDVGQFDAADSVIAWGLTLVRDRDDQQSEAELLVGQGELLSQRKKWAEAIEAFESAKGLYEVTRDVFSGARVRLHLVKAHGSAGDDQAAATALREGEAFSRAYVLTEAEAQFAVERAVMAMRQKQTDDAAVSLDEAIRLFGALSDRHPGLARLETLRNALSNDK